MKYPYLTTGLRRLLCIITVIATGFKATPDGKSRYTQINRPMFTSDSEQSARMERMYGYQRENVAAGVAPEPVQAPAPQVVQPKPEQPVGRMEVGSKIPPFLQRIKDKNNR